MIRLINLIVFILFSLVSFAQEKCNCPKEYNHNDVANRIFKFKNGNVLGLCGDEEKVGKEVLYSNAILFQCKTKKVLSDFDGYNPYRIKLRNDTLFVSELNWLPFGNQLHYISIPIDTTKFYYSSGRLINTRVLNTRLPKYSEQQISSVLHKYMDIEKLKMSNNYDSIIAISDMLFCAYASGSKQAEKYLTQIEKKCGPFDGAISEEWNEIWTVYLDYKEQSSKSKIKQ